MDVTVLFHFSNVERCTRFLDRYRDFLSRVVLYGSYPDDLAINPTDQLKSRFQLLRSVENTGLDFGGFFALLPHVRTMYVIKVHDKSNENWLHNAFQPIVEHADHVITTGAFYFQGCDPMQSWTTINAYWLHRLHKMTGVPVHLSETFRSGSMFLVRRSIAVRLLDEISELWHKHACKEGRFDPSWVAYHYDMQDVPSRVEPSFADAVRARWLAIPEPRYNNGFEYVRKTGNALYPNGWAIRDGMLEHSLERFVAAFALYEKFRGRRGKPSNDL